MILSVTLPRGTAQTSTSVVFLLNGTFYLTLAGAAVWLWSRVRSGSSEEATGRLARLAISGPALALLFLSAAFNLGSAIYLGYIVPRDIMQDIISAQRFVCGQPAFPENMTEDVRRTMDRQPAPVSLSRWLPGLSAVESKAYQDLVTEPWTQAHPASMTLLLALFGTWLRVRHIYLLSALVSLTALVTTLGLIRKELGLAQSRRLAAAVLMLVTGWFPVWIGLRTGQISLVLAFLLTLCWYYLRRDRAVAAGLCAGVAVALKLFPGLLLVYFLLRKRKAFWSGAIASGLLVGLSFGFVGRENTQDYLRVVHFVQEYYKTYPGNLSLLGFLAGIMPAAEARWHAASTMFHVLGAVFVLAATWLATRAVEPGQDKEATDLEFAIFVGLMTLLSPVSWDHYLVVLFLPLGVLFSAWLRDPKRAASLPWAIAILFATIGLAIPQPIGAWLGRLANSSYSLFLLKLPGVGAGLVIVLLFLMRLKLSSQRCSGPASV